MTRYQLLLRCENVPIRNKNRLYWWMEKMYGTYMVVHDPTTQTPIGRTEIVYDTPDPEYAKVLFIESDVNSSGVYRPLQLIVYEDNGIGRDATALWHAQIEVTEVLQSKGHEQVITLSKSSSSSKAGQIIVRMVESPSSSATRSRMSGTSSSISLLMNLNPSTWVKMQFRALDIKNVEPGWFGLGRSDPYFTISKKSVDPNLGWVRWHIVYRSEVIRNHLNPYWEPFQVTWEELCFGDPSTPLRLCVYNDNKRKPHTLIGQLETTFEQLQNQISQRGNADRTRAMSLFREHKTTKTRGWFVVLQATPVDSMES